MQLPGLPVPLLTLFTLQPKCSYSNASLVSLCLQHNLSASPTPSAPLKLQASSLPTCPFSPLSGDRWQGFLSPDPNPALQQGLQRCCHLSGTAFHTYYSSTASGPSKILLTLQISRQKRYPTLLIPRPGHSSWWHMARPPKHFQDWNHICISMIIYFEPPRRLKVPEKQRQSLFFLTLHSIQDLTSRRQTETIC